MACGTRPQLVARLAVFGRIAIIEARSDGTGSGETPGPGAALPAARPAVRGGALTHCRRAQQGRDAAARRRLHPLRSRHIGGATRERGAGAEVGMPNTAESAERCGAARLVGRYRGNAARAAVRGVVAGADRPAAAAPSATRCSPSTSRARAALCWASSPTATWSGRSIATSTTMPPPSRTCRRWCSPGCGRLDGCWTSATRRRRCATASPWTPRCISTRCCRASTCLRPTPFPVPTPPRARCRRPAGRCRTPTSCWCAWPTGRAARLPVQMPIPWPMPPRCTSWCADVHTVARSRPGISSRSAG